MSDDLARKLESLQRSLEMLPTDLGRKLDRLDTQLGKVDRQLGGLDKSAQEAVRTQKEIQRQLEALGEQVTTYIDEDRAARRTQFALTALVDARAEHDRQFGHHQMVRRSATGMLRVMTTGTARPAALLRTAEQLMVDASGYWLSPALIALAAWVGNSPVSAERAVLEAVSRDPGRSALFFSLVLARFGRQGAAARWITEYARAQDCGALTGEFTAVLDAVAGGALGARARERLLDACRGWRDQIGQSGEWEAKQVASWTEFIRGQRRPLTDTFDPLGTVSRDWVAKLGRLEAATAFGHTEQWLKGRLGGTSEGDEILRAAAADFLTLATAIATGAYQSELSEQAVRFCLVLSGTSVERAVTDLSQQVRSTYPASIEVDIEGWHHAMEPGDDPDALVQEFLGWAHEALIEDKAQATRRRLSMGRTSARLEHIESIWDARRQGGPEKVYLATMQANFFQKWQQGIAAVERCVGLLRAESTGVWCDAQESGTVPGPSRPAMKLPDWDPRPPAFRGGP